MSGPRRWLHDIDPSWDAETAAQSIRQWRTDARRIAETLGRQLVRQSGNAAFTGRAVTFNHNKPNEKKVYYSAPKVYNWFLSAMNKIYQE